MASSHSFLWLSSISLQVYVAHLLYPSSVNGLLCCFHVLVIVNSAIMNIGVRVSFWIIVLSRYMPGVGLLDHIATLLLVFWVTSILCSIVAAPLTFLPKGRRFPFFPYPPAFVICRLFNDGHSDWCEVVPHCIFDLHFSNNQKQWASFHVHVGHLYGF